ncbi:unnamed protein product [Calypogeia fissa]
MTTRGETRQSTIVVKRRKKEVVREEEPYMELLPGIADHVTLEFIAPKFFHTLLCQPCLASSDKSVYHLPPIPSVTCGIPRSCNCVTMDGKIYILGGLEWGVCTGDVFVLDVARGRRLWKQCASMKTRRKHFGCSAFDGKIYVFGGHGEGHNCSGVKSPVAHVDSEVYDPEADAWTAISPMPSWRSGHKVGIMGKELLVSNGLYFGRNVEDPCVSKETRRNYDSYVGHDLVYRCGLEAYDPEKDMWRTILSDDFGKSHLDLTKDKLFIANSKLYMMTSQLGISILDLETNSIVELHSSDYSDVGGFSFPGESYGSWPKEVTVVDDDRLVAIFLHQSSRSGYSS